MKIEDGCIIKSTLKLADDYFANTFVFILQHNHKGTIGLVLNKKTRRKIQIGNINYTVYNGGPMNTVYYNLLHTDALTIKGGIHVIQGIYWNTLIENNSLASLPPTLKNLKIIKGYCGWDKDELEVEIFDGYWDVLEAKADLVFI